MNRPLKYAHAPAGFLAPAAISLLLAGLVLWTGFSLFASYGDRFRPHYPPLAIHSHDWQIADTPGGRNFMQVIMQLPLPLDTHEIDRIKLVFGDTAGYFELEFGWSESDEPDSFRFHPIFIDRTGNATLDTSYLIGWSGTIEFVMIRGWGAFLSPPDVYEIRVRYAKLDFIQFQKKFFAEWFDWKPWAQTSINRTLVSDGKPMASPVTVVAAWLGLAIFGLSVYKGIKYGIFPIYPLVGMLIAGWLVLDLRWQGELLFKLIDTRGHYSGKDWREKRAAEVDGAVFTFFEALKSRLTDRDVRLLVFAGSDYAHHRARYFAMPLPTHSGFWPPKPIIMRRVRKGDLLVLVDQPSIQPETGFSIPAEYYSQHLPVVFNLEEVAGRHATAISSNGRISLELEDDGIWLVESAWTAAPVPGFYRLRAKLAAAKSPGWARLRVVYLPEGGNRMEIAEREVYIPGPDPGEYELSFVIPDTGRVQYRIRTIDAVGLQVRGLAIEGFASPEDLTWLPAQEGRNFLVLRPMMASDTVRAFEIQ